MSLLLSTHDTSCSVKNHLSATGIVQSMTVQEIAAVLCMLVVNEWRGNQADEYKNFLHADFDYYQQVRNYKEAGYFGGALGDPMPIAMSNVLQMPLVIITQSHTHLSSAFVCNSSCFRVHPCFWHTLRLVLATMMLSYQQMSQKVSATGRNMFNIFLSK